MRAAFRMPAGGRIARGETLSFRFDGRIYTGHPGDTLASALLAHGVHLLGRSFKYHRPRGVLAAGSEEPNALVEIDRGGGRRTPNLRATEVALYDGLVARSQNRAPALSFDLGRINDFFAPLLSAGFYYKTFMWPRRAWRMLYEPLIRRAAGLGRAPEAPDPDRYANRFGHCDVLIVGGGPAGLMAALAASAGEARVVLVDEQAACGGSLLDETTATIAGQPAPVWLAETLATLNARATVRLLRCATAFGYYAENFIAIAERVTEHLADPDPGLPRERLWQMRAREVVLATGATERPLVFPGNDRPGVMLAGAARTYLNRYAVRPGRRAVIVTACDSAYQAASDLAAAGVEVALIADLRDTLPAVASDLAARGIRVAAGMTVLGTQGGLRVRSVAVAPARGGASVRLACDLVLMSGGWTPAIHLFSQSRGQVRFAADLGAFIPDRSVQRERSAGACRGLLDLAETLADGARAGAAAARAAGFPVPDLPRPAVAGAITPAGFHLGLCPRAAATRAFVDFQNDVTAKDIARAAQEGFHAIEHVKRYTTTGMATDQGKTSNLNALALVAAATGRAIPEVGLTSFRPPYTPVTFGTLAGLSRGALFDPVRTTPIHPWAEARGAVFEDVGAWRRARYFPRSDEDMHAAIARECRATREALGLLDASTLGKIEVVGPDAAEFLERFYVNALRKLGVGRCRYGLALGENGFVRDDGVIGRLAPDRFHVTTTTGGATATLDRMEDYLQTEWPDLHVWLTSTTEHWAVLAVQGPQARAALAPLITDIDLAPAAFPPMSVRVGHILGVATRLFRVSFTGELGFEINVPADYAGAVWEAVAARVAACGGAVYGTEAMHVLRAEKGYAIIGQETDGTVTPGDLGLDWTIGKEKTDFIGKRALALPDLRRPGRKQLVGLLTTDPALVLEEGAQIIAGPNPSPGSTALGHVTSAYPSATLGRSIALGLVAAGRQRLGARLYAQTPGGVAEVDLVSPVFFDPAGRRIDG